MGHYTFTFERTNEHLAAGSQPQNAWFLIGESGKKAKRHMTRCLDSTICWQWLCWCHKWNQKLIEIGKQILRSMTWTTRELEREVVTKIKLAGKYQDVQLVQQEVRGHMSGSTTRLNRLFVNDYVDVSSEPEAQKIPRSTTRERGRGHLALDTWLNWLWMSRCVVSQNWQVNTKSCTTRCTKRER